MTAVPEPSAVHTAAVAWLDAGCAPIPAKADGSKAPAGEWKQYQTVRPTRAQVDAWFGAGHPGLGVVCGKVSGGLIMVELEGRAVAEGMLARASEIALAAGDADLWRRVLTGYGEYTPSGGVHLIYRIAGDNIPGNQKLARRPRLEGPGVDVLAETRGEGGFVVVAPSSGAVHPTGKAWAMFAGSPATIPTLTLDEHTAVCSILRALDEMPPPIIADPTPAAPRADGELAPGADYEARMSWAELLGRHGWRIVRQRGHVCDWIRPGKTDAGISATTGYGDTDHLYVFSSSTEFETERSYTKFGALAVLEHGGDMRAAASALRKDGYGGQRPEISPLQAWAPDLAAPAPGFGDHVAALSTAAPEHKDNALTLVEHTSWWPRDLVALIAGDTSDEIQPEVLARRDGERLFYPGKVNGLIGESESGKTWVALLAAWQAISVGENVLILDFEDTAAGIIGRLRRFGANDKQLAHVTYISPEEMLHPAARADLEAVLRDKRPVLTIVDGYNAAMGLLGLDYESNVDVIKFSATVLKAIAKTGSAIITVDHVTKAKEGRGSYAIGAQAKRAEVDGCLLIVEAIDPFGVGVTGRLKLTVAKDRPGLVRGKSAGAKHAGDVEFKSDKDGNVTLKIEGPDMRTREEKGPFRPTVYMERISAFLLDVKEATGNAVEKGVKGNAVHIRDGLAQLVDEGYVSRGPGPRGGVLYGYLRPFVVDLGEWNPDGGGDRDE